MVGNDPRGSEKSVPTRDVGPSSEGRGVPFLNLLKGPDFHPNLISGSALGKRFTGFGIKKIKLRHAQKGREGEIAGRANWGDPNVPED